MTKENQVYWSDGINIVMALWLIVSPYIFGYASYSEGMYSLFLGIVIGIVALIRVFMPLNSTWLSWINIVLGLWLIVSPFLMMYTSTVALWNNVILGIIVTAMEAWSTTASSTMGRHA